MDLIVTNFPPGIPLDLQEMFGYLTGQMFILQDKWQLFLLLFCTSSEENTELFRQSGKSVFDIFYWSLRDDLILSICKLADPAVSGRDKYKQNLVFKQLKEELYKLDETQYQDLIKKLDTHYVSINKEVKKLKDWRDKHVAHLDYSTAIQGSLKVLPYISTDIFKQAILAFEGCWNEFYCYFTNTPPLFFTICPPNYDITALISKLKKALAYDELAREGKIDRRFWRKVNIGKTENRLS